MNKICLTCPKCNKKSEVSVNTTFGPRYGGHLISWNYKCSFCGFSKHAKFSPVAKFLHIFFSLSVMILYLVLMFKIFGGWSEGGISKLQVEKVGLSWNDVSEKMIKHGWAEKINLTEVGLKKDPDVTKDAMFEVFGNDFTKILPILKESHAMWNWIFIGGLLGALFLTFPLINLWLTLWLQTCLGKNIHPS